jgi:phenylalanyl-tRNA synthetase beta chain
LCETGRVFIERNGQNLECAAVAFIIAEPVGERAWLKREPADFYTAKHHIAALAGAAGIDFARQPLAPIAGPLFGWQEGQSASAGNIEHGWTARFGLLNLALLKSLGLEGKVYAGIFAILPERITGDAARRRYSDFSLFPAALRDLALVVDQSVSAMEVQKTLAKHARAAAGNAFAVEHVGVFDVYQGKGLPDGKKSLAFSLVFRSAERTLTDDEVNAVFGKIQKDISADGKISVRT